MHGVGFALQVLPRILKEYDAKVSCQMMEVRHGMEGLLLLLINLELLQHGMKQHCIGHEVQTRP